MRLYIQGTRIARAAFPEIRLRELLQRVEVDLLRYAPLCLCPDRPQIRVGMLGLIYKSNRSRAVRTSPASQENPLSK